MADTKRKDAIAEIFALASFVAFILSGLAFGGIAIANHLLPAIGVDMAATMSNGEVVLFLIAACIVTVFIIYCAVIAWMVFGRFFLAPRLVWKVAKIGPLSKLDRWLLRIIVGREPQA